MDALSPVGPIDDHDIAKGQALNIFFIMPVQTSEALDSSPNSGMIALP